MKKVFTYLPWALIICLILLFWQNPFHIFLPQQTISTDTVYIDKPYVVEKIVEKDKVVVKEVKIYKTQYDTIQTINIIKDTVFIKTESGQAINYSPQFITQFPFASKFLNSHLSTNRISFAYMDPGGSSKEEFFDIDLSLYTYKIGYDNHNNLSISKNKLSFLDYIKNNTSQTIFGGIGNLRGVHIGYKIKIPIYKNIFIAPNINIGKSLEYNINAEYKF